MAKRKIQTFERNKRDFYPTPPEAVTPLINFIEPLKFVEPCAGDGALRNTLVDAGFKCTRASDIEPRGPKITEQDALALTEKQVASADAIITNPPFKQKWLAPMLTHWLTLGKPVILLLPSDVLVNIWFAPFAPHVTAIKPIGRVRWIPDSTQMSMENFAWVALDPKPLDTPFIHPRDPRKNRSAA